MNKTIKKIFVCVVLVMLASVIIAPAAFASEEVAANSETAESTITAASNTEGSEAGSKAIAAAIAIGIAAGAGAIGMGVSIAKAVEGISRQPEAEGKIRTSLMLGLVFIETAIIYALIVAILVVFVL